MVSELRTSKLKAPSSIIHIYSHTQTNYQVTLQQYQNHGFIMQNTNRIVLEELPLNQKQTSFLFQVST